MRHYFVLFVVLPALAACAIPSFGTKVAEAPSGTPLFQDDFSSAASGWSRIRNDGGIMDYDSGGYRILVNARQSNVWSTPHRDFSNTRLEVDAGKLAGPDANRIGLICRLQGTSYYFFIIGSDGYYGLGIARGGQASLFGQTAMQASDAIRTGAAINHLRLDCNGSTLTAYINGTRVGEAQDQTLTHGDVGLLAGAFEQPGVDIVFDNFVALQP